MSLGKAYELLADGTVAVHERQVMWQLGDKRLPLGSYFPSAISPGNWMIINQVNGGGKIISPDEVPKAILMAHLIGM